MENVIEIIGYISSLLLAICALPQFIRTLRTGHSKNIDVPMYFIWAFGEIFGIIYVSFKHGMDLPLLLNYSVNLVFLLTILYYWRNPRGDKC